MESGLGLARRRPRDRNAGAIVASAIDRHRDDRSSPASAPPSRRRGSPPLAALRDVAVDRSGASVRRAVVGVLVAGAGRRRPRDRHVDAGGRAGPRRARLARPARRRRRARPGRRPSRRGGARRRPRCPPRRHRPPRPPQRDAQPTSHRRQRLGADGRHRRRRRCSRRSARRSRRRSTRPSTTTSPAT